MHESIVEESINAGCSVVINNRSDLIVIAIYSAADPRYLMLIGRGPTADRAVVDIHEAKSDEVCDLEGCFFCGQ